MTENVLDKLKEAIDLEYEDAQEDGFRNHLGFSLLGRECARENFYSWRWATKTKHAGRILRIFGRGHDTEPKMHGWLEKAGFNIETVDPATGKQYLASYLGGFFGGSCDGIITGVPSWFTHQPRGLFECKSHNTKSFVNMVNKGGVVNTKPEHYAQTQCYMHSFECEWALYCALNKNDEDLYFEIIPYQKAIAEALFEKATDIALRTTTPKRISNDPNFFKCNFCDYKGVCHLKEMVHKSCRSCESVTPRVNAETGQGEWFCSRFGAVIPDDWLKKGCDQWKNGLS